MNKELLASLVAELQDWPGPSLSSHKSASQFFHKLVFVAEAGFRVDSPGMTVPVERILDSLDENCIPCLPMKISEAYSGSGQPVQAWALCDAPSILYALKVLGVDDPRIDRGVAHLATRGLANGFGCLTSPALKGWHGPGKKGDPCPYATLIMLKLLLLFGNRYREQVLSSAECLVDLWQNSREKHPYIFYMGTDFRKLKLPMFWYDILHVLDVLSRVEEYRSHPAVLEMHACVMAKAGPDGFVPESVYLPWKDWDFGQKKRTSTTMTALIQAITARLTG